MLFKKPSITSPKTLYKTNRIYALFLIVFGIVFIAIPERVSSILLYLIVIMLVTPAGRLISTVVGIYGIIVFSLITSIFINLYNENKNRKKTDGETKGQED